MSTPHNLFNTLQSFDLGNGSTGQFYSLPALEKAGVGPISKLPISVRLVLESVLRNCDGLKVQEANVLELANWKANESRTAEIPFVVARIVLQDFTGVPLLVDLAAMRSAVAKLGKNPKIIEPLVPVDLVVDHSVQVDFAGSGDSLQKNLDLEFTRNRERYQFLKWGMQAFDTFKVVPPGIGIVHQVNLEYLAKGVLSAGGVYYPDTLVGTDSHTTMINGLGIVGWGVGGIEAEAGMLGQPVYFLTPDVVGVHLTGAIREGVTATDVALTVTQMLRKAKVVGKFVEFFGPGAAALPLVDRATIANMAPEYGATMGFFPIDEECTNYLRATGRTEEHIALYKNYYQAQGLWGMPQKGEIEYSQVVELDLSSVGPVRFIFPNAPVMPVTINGGYQMPAWYDILGADLTQRQDEAGLRHSQLAIDALIEREQSRGIASHRIVLAGFSQGCAMTLMTGLRHCDRLAGLLCMSGYLPLADKTAAERSPANQDVPIFMALGTRDPVVLLPRATFDSHDAADALAIAITHAHHRGSLASRLAAAAR